MGNDFETLSAALTAFSGPAFVVASDSCAVIAANESGGLLCGGAKRAHFFRMFHQSEIQRLNAVFRAGQDLGFSEGRNFSLVGQASHGGYEGFVNLRVVRVRRGAPDILLVAMEPANHGAGKDISHLLTVGRLTAEITHEIGNALSVIVLCLHALEDAMQTEGIVPPYARFVAKAQRMTERITRTIHGVRLLSRDGSVDPWARVPFEAIVTDTLEICLHRMRERKIEFRHEKIADLFVTCRPVQILQVLTNLLNNAIDAVGAVAETKDRWIHLRVAANSAVLKISVEDSGACVPQEVSGHIIEPFFTTKKYGSGTGIGLGISQRIVQSHGGRLYLDETADHTRFVIELPRTP